MSGAESQGRPLNERQRRFAELYHQSGNVAKAAIEAGYSEKYARADACKILDNPSVSAYLENLREKAASERISTARERQEFLTAVMRGQVEDASLFFGAVVKRPSSVRDRIKAAEVLGRMQGDFEGDGAEKPQVIIRLPARAMTPEELEAARAET